MLPFCLLLLGSAFAHPPSGAKKGPSKATPILKQALAAKKRGDLKGYEAALFAAKKVLAEEGRFACCIKGGCAVCALEGNCGCAENLFAKKGVCKTCLEGIKAGNGRYDNLTPELLFEQLMAMEMKGSLGPWSMSREGSGTSWLPESSPLYGRMSERGRWQLMQMGMAFGAATEAGGTRGESQAYGATQYMLMGQRRDAAERVLGLRGMFSLDALTNGKQGYPNLFQTGETVGGQPLKDRQHPHDLFMELAATYSAPLTATARGFLYLAPAGEPALGPAAFPHRPSAWDNPAAPISHHWLDGSHITFGVATAGVAAGDQWKLEGSAFTGSEPGENRFNLDPIQLNSYSGRITHNPSKELSLQASYGFLKSPEALEPGVHQHRFTASAMVNKAWESGDNLAAMVAFGQNRKSDTGKTSRALLVEAALTQGRKTFFARWDSAEKNELVGVPSGVYRVEKRSLGGLYNVKQDEQGQQAVGASLDFYAYPAALRSAYGRAPVSATVFYRWRFGRMGS